MASDYLDGRVTTLHPLGAFLTARLILRTIQNDPGGFPRGILFVPSFYPLFAVTDLLAGPR
jgi:hypothetical protein